MDTPTMQLIKGNYIYSTPAASTKWDCSIVAGRYVNGNRLYLMLVENDTGEEVIDITVWAPLHGFRALNRDEMLVKTYDMGSEGLVDFLSKYNIAEPTGESIQVNWVDIPVYKLKPDFFNLITI